MADDADAASRRKQVVENLTSFGAAQTELLRRFARSNGMHPTDAAAVVQIVEHEDRGELLIPARLAEAIGLSPGATSILLARLEAAGFIQRTREHPDRRIVTLRSTKTINDAADAFFDPLAGELDHALTAFTIAELETLERATDLLRTVVASYVSPSP